MTIDTLPCSGTYACICKHSNKEYYRVSKTFPVIPLDYAGLSSKLYDAYIEPEIIEEEEGEDEILKWGLIIGGGVAGLILLCCAGYYLMYYCANRVHKVSYMEEYENEKKKK